MHRRLAVLVALQVILVSGGVACSCISPDAHTAVKNADLVFRGKLINVDYVDQVQYVPHPRNGERKIPGPRRFLATFKVNGVWKGQIAPTMVLYTREGSSDCVGFSMTIGEEFLVFANEAVMAPKAPGMVHIPDWSDRVPIGQKIVSPGVCTLNSEINGAKKTLKALGRPKRRAKQ